MARQSRDVAATLKGVIDPGDWIGMKPALDPSSALLALDHKSDPFEVKLRIGLGLFVVGVVAVVVYVLDDWFAYLIACSVGFFGLMNLIIGIAKMRFEKSMLFTGHDVHVKTRTLLGGADWREPIANYRGVLMREEHLRRQGVGTTAGTKTYHVIELVHRNIGKTLPLYVREGGDAPREMQEAFARRFRLPALAPDSGGMAARETAAMDVPISEQPSADPGPPPSGITIRDQDGAVRITVGQGRLGGILVWVYWLAIPLMFGGVGFMIDPVAGLAAGGMAVLFVLMMLGLGRLMGGSAKARAPALVVEQERIWIDRPSHDDRVSRFARRILSSVSGHDLRSGKRPPEAIGKQSIEQIRVDTYTSHYSGASSASGRGGSTVHDRLVIEGDDGRLNFIGTQFDRKKLEWVRDYLRHELAGGP